MKPSSATSTLKQLAEMLRAAIGYIGGDEDDEVEASKRIAKVIAALEAAPPAAERTALENIRTKIEQDFDFWVGFGYSDHSILRDDILKMKATILKEFADASEGTKSE